MLTRVLIGVWFLAILLAPTPDWAALSGMVPAVSGGATPAILSGTTSFSVSSGVSSATVAPSITISMSSGGFTGTLALATQAGCTSTDNASFSLSGSTLTTVGSLSAATYHICYSAVQGGATSSCTITSGSTCYTAATIVASAFSTSLTLINDSGSPQAAGVPTQTFGMGFPDASLCGGAAPVFTDGSSNVLKYSYGLLTYWPSGCLKFGSFMVLPQLSTAANPGTQTITVTGGGTWPSASGRSISTDVYAQNLNAQMPAAAPSGANLTGTWGSWLDSAANTNNNNYRVVQWMDGSAGAAWKVSTHMAQTKTGSPHAELIFDHYIVALNNSSGNLGGFRWLGATRQPLADNNAKAFRAFAPSVYPAVGTVTNGPNWQTCVGVGGCTAAPGNQSGAVPLSFGGTDGNPMVGQSFTMDTNSTNCGNQGMSTPCLKTSASNNYWLGSYFGDVGNVIPAYFTGGSLPTSSPQVDTSNIYWLRSNQTGGVGNYTANPYLAFTVNGTIGGSQASGVTFSTTGSGTITPISVVEPFTRIWWADSKGRYNFFQGTGTITAETTLRVEINQTYAISTHTMLPYDLSISGAAKGGAVAQTTFAEPTPNWNPFQIGQLWVFQQSGGDHEDLGPLPNDAATAFYNDTALDDLVVRSDGLAGGLTPADIKDSSTDTFINLLDVAGTTTYAGLPNSTSTTFKVGYNPGGCAGYTCPVQPQWSTVFANIDGSHKPNYSVFAYWKTGELQYIELVAEQAQFGLLVDNTIVNRNPPDPSGGATLRGVISAFCCELRAQAWDHRDIQWAAGLYPYDPSGTATTYGCSNAACNGSTGYGSSDYALGKYLYDMGSRNMQFAAHLMDPANSMFGSSTSYAAGCATAPATPCSSGGRALIGLEGPNIDNSGAISVPVGYFSYIGGEESNYGIWAYLIASMLRQDANANQYLKYWMSGQASLLANPTVGGFNVYSFVNKVALPQPFNGFGGPAISADSDFLQKVEGGPWGNGSGSWGTSSRVFHFINLNGLMMAAGDIFEFCGDAETGGVATCITADAPNGFSVYTPYYAFNLQTITPGVEYKLDLGAAGAHCSATDQSGCVAIIPGSSGSYTGSWVGWYNSSTPLGTGAQDAFYGGEGVATAYYAAYNTYRFLLGNDNSVGPMLTDINARLTTDIWNPATGSIYSGTAFIPRYSMHY